jgi:NAD(P)-dependent dehydrogenase (short-subunit alcohol dehydrogenase family)
LPTVFITGATRGIGRAACERMVGAGWKVYGSVRDPDASVPDGVTPIVLDVTKADTIERLDSVLPAELDAIVNNAGIVVSGPVEALAIEDLREQFEVNVIGQVAVTQAVLPRLRKSRGRIVFISSVSGRITTPMTGAYNASKYAIEAIGDALRQELRPWGIRVSLIEPGAVDTDMWRGALDTADETEAALSDEHRSLYSEHIAGLKKSIPTIQKQAAPVDKITAAIAKALLSSRPRARYVVGLDSKAQLGIVKGLPTPVADAVLGKILSQPGKG